MPDKLVTGMVIPSFTVLSETWLTVGISLTVTTRVVPPVAHWPGVVVNVYVPEAWLLISAGLQVPSIPFAEVVGNKGAAAPRQTDKVVPKSNAGSRIGFTVTVRVNLPRHCSGVALGVNVYTPEAWLSTMAGSHVPSILLVDVTGRVGTSPPVQIDKVGSRSNVGATLGVTVTVKVVIVPHDPATGVKV